MADKAEEPFTNDKSVRNSLLNDKEQEIKAITLKYKIIIAVLSVCVVGLIIGFVVYAILKEKVSDDEEKKEEPEPIIEAEQEFSITIEVFKYRKGRGD